MRRSVTKVVVFCSAIIAVLLVPIEIPSSIEATATIAPAREWTLSKTADGTIVSTVHDHLRGRTEEFTAVEPQRGDAVRFTFTPGVLQRDFLDRGDEVGSIRSHEMERTLSRLRGDLLVDEALLAVQQSGEKDALVQQARHQLAFEKKELERKRTQHRRLSQLHEQALVSDEEFELGRSAVELSEINVEIANTRLEAAISGVRESEIDLAAARISALRSQIRELERQIADLTIRAPFSGIVIHQKREARDPEILLNIADTTSLVIMAPVEFRQRMDIEPGQKMQLRIPGKREKVSAEVVHIDNRVQVLNGRQVVFVTALMTGENNPIVPGVRARASITTQSMTIRQQIARFIKDVLDT